LGLKLTHVQDTFLLIKSGLKLWPLVSLFNFTVVPVHRRIIVGSVVGLFWGIYLSLFINQDTPAA
jgi:protein Mpv17